MNNREFHRLYQYHQAKLRRFKPARNITSRRSAKSMRNATGQKFLKTGRIVSEVGLETLFIERKGI